MLSVDTDILKSTDLLLNPKLFLRMQVNVDVTYFISLK